MAGIDPNLASAVSTLQVILAGAGAVAVNNPNAAETLGIANILINTAMGAINAGSDVTDAQLAGFRKAYADARDDGVALEETMAAAGQGKNPLAIDPTKPLLIGT